MFFCINIGKRNKQCNLQLTRFEQIMTTVLNSIKKKEKKNLDVYSIKYLTMHL